MNWIEKVLPHGYKTYIIAATIMLILAIVTAIVVLKNPEMLGMALDKWFYMLPSFAVAYGGSKLADGYRDKLRGYNLSDESPRSKPNTEVG